MARVAVRWPGWRLGGQDGGSIRWMLGWPCLCQAATLPPTHTQAGTWLPPTHPRTPSGQHLAASTLQMTLAVVDALTGTPVWKNGNYDSKWCGLSLPATTHHMTTTHHLLSMCEQ